jgi:anti-sigma factor RsiW
MTDCPNGEIRDQLPDFVHDQLSTNARAAVAAHVARCSACAAELALLRELRATLRPVPAVDVARVVAALPAPPRVARGVPFGRSGRRRLDWRIAAAIAALVVGGGSAAILSGRVRESDAGGTQVARQAPPEAPGVQKVAAADLSIDVDFGEASVVELEALLEDLEAFDGLPAGEPEPAPASPAAGEEGL